MNAATLGMSLGSLLVGEALPTIVLPLLSTLLLLLAGFFIRASTISACWKWLYWLSFVQWAFAAVMVNQFEGQAYLELCLDDDVNIPILDGLSMDIGQEEIDLFFNIYGCEPVLGSNILGMFDIEHRDKWECVVYMLGTLPVLVCCVYIGIRFVRHEKR